MSRTDNIRILLEKVRSFGELPLGWDSYSGLPACKRAMLFAYAVLSRLAISKAPLPRVSPISTGVFLSWPRLDIEIDDESVVFDFKDGRDSVECTEYDSQLAMTHIEEATE